MPLFPSVPFALSKRHEQKGGLPCGAPGETQLGGPTCPPRAAPVSLPHSHSVFLSPVTYSKRPSIIAGDTALSVLRCSIQGAELSGRAGAGLSEGLLDLTFHRLPLKVLVGVVLLGSRTARHGSLPCSKKL